MCVKGSRVTEIEVTHALQSTIMLFHIGSILQYHCILEYNSVCPKFFQNRSGVQRQSFGSARRRGIQWSTGGVSFMASGDCPSVRRRLCARLQQLGDSSNANVSSHLCLEGGTEMIHFDVTTKTSVNSLRRGSKRTGHVTFFT